MALDQSLTSAVSGMITSQLDLDTIANDLANLNTNGFKATSVSFADALTQTSSAGSAPAAGLGGTNPEQLGLGVQTAAVTVDMSQGALSSTGNPLDAAIQGAGFFTVANSNNGTLGQAQYTRVGDFGLDANNNLVEQSSGLEVVGEQTNSSGTTIGSPTTINTTADQSIAAQATQNITLQGNLSSADTGLTGPTLTTAFPLTTVNQAGVTSVATINTPISQLTTLNTSVPSNQTPALNNFTPPAPPASPDRTIYVVGTQSDGTAYSGQFTINPWTSTVQDLMNNINSVLTQGGNTIGQVTFSNGTMTASSLGTGDSFSMYLGENNPDPDVTAMAASTSPVAGLTSSTAGSPAFPTTPYTIQDSDEGTLNPTFALVASGGSPITTSASTTITALVNGQSAGTITIPPGVYDDTDQFTFPTGINAAPGATVQYQFSGAAVTNVSVTTPTSGLAGGGAAYSGNGLSETLASHTVLPGEAGLLEPSFNLPALPGGAAYGTAGNSLTITVEINGVDAGTITPTGTGPLTNLGLNSFPHVAAGDVVTYQISGSQAVPAGISWTTNNALDSNVANLTADTNGDGIPDMNQTGSATDIDAWQYQKSTNATMNWYEMRFASSYVPTSIQVYSPDGTVATLSAVMFNTGTAQSTTNGVTSENSSWDMILNMSPTKGTIPDNVITGLQFNSSGDFVGTGALGTTAHGKSLENSNNYVGSPGTPATTINWANGGSSTINLNFGSANSTTGLTGFGSADSASMVGQDGAESGTLQSLSVNDNGNLVGVYSNGKTLPLYQLQIATFANPAGLTNTGGNLWQTSVNSGSPILHAPGSDGAGTVSSGVLEGSNVNISSDFTELITAQRGFQVNARVIQTEDSLLEELTTLNTPAQ